MHRAASALALVVLLSCVSTAKAERFECINLVVGFPEEWGFNSEGNLWRGRTADDQEVTVQCIPTAESGQQPEPAELGRVIEALSRMLRAPANDPRVRINIPPTESNTLTGGSLSYAAYQLRPGQPALSFALLRSPMAILWVSWTGEQDMIEKSLRKVISALSSAKTQ